MNTPFRHDTQPWYRQFWPWFLILLPASVVVAGLATLVIANRHADDLVVDEYYKNGLAINRQLEKKQRAAQLGIKAALEFSSHSIAVTMEGPVANDMLYLALSHPLEADRDFSVQLKRVEQGFYAGSLQQPVLFRWHWTLEDRGEPGWRLDGSVNLVDSRDNAGLN